MESISNKPTGVELIALERQRQIAEEGYTAHHDDEHEYDGQMAQAAACYALPESLRGYDHFKGVRMWPWDKRYWKPRPDNRVAELIKAGALIAAEIDRLQRP